MDSAVWAFVYVFIRKERERMTREEAREELITFIGTFECPSLEAVEVAIEALKAQDRPIICPRCGRTFAESEGRE